MRRSNAGRDEIYSVALLTPPVAESDAEVRKAIRGLVEEEGPVPKALREFHARIGERFPSAATNTEADLDGGIYMDGGVWASYGHRAAVVSMPVRNAEYAIPAIVRTAFDLGLRVYDQASGFIHRPEGYPDVTLRVGDWPPLPGPTARQIGDAVDRLTPRGGPAHMCLETRGPDYVQAAGGDGAYALEWRDHSGARYRHWAAGSRGKPQGTRIRIKTNGHTVPVYENERLSAGDVKAILVAFAQGRKRPVEYAWRDMTAELV